MGIQNHPPRISTAWNPTSEARVIGYDGSHPRHHGVHLIAQLMNHAAGIRAADPARITGCRCDFSIQRDSQLKNHKREPPRDIFCESLVESPAFLFKEPEAYPNTGSSELPKSPARNERIRVLHA